MTREAMSMETVIIAAALSLWGITLMSESLILQAISTSILIGMLVKGIWSWFSNRQEPHIEASILLRPFQKDETYAKKVTIPERRQVVLYFAIQALDDRKYEGSTVWVYFKGPFSIIYSDIYNKMYFGKPFRPFKRTEIILDLDHALIKGKTGPLIFPVIVDAPKVGKYDVDVEFMSESVGKKSGKDTLQLECAMDNFSHDERFFDPKEFLP